jgi:protein gp37
MATTKINWADKVWNFLKGCDRVSDGCDNCYAITQVHLHAGNPKMAAEFGGLTHRAAGRTDWTGTVRYVPERLHDPLHSTKPWRWFINSLSDLFHADVPSQVIADAFAVIACCPEQTFLSATKRHARMRSVLNDPEFIALYRAAYEKLSADLRRKNPRRWGDLPETAPWPLLNLHLGVSAENQKWWDIRIPALLDCRDAAGVLWVSYEPALGPLDATMCGWAPAGVEGFAGVHNPLNGEWWPAVGDAAEEYANRITDLPALDWIVAGGESGPRARSCEHEWILSLRGQCRDASVPFWMKQTGVVLARQLGLPGKGEDFDLLPAEYQVRELPQLAVAA